MIFVGVIGCDTCFARQISTHTHELGAFPCLRQVRMEPIEPFNPSVAGQGIQSSASDSSAMASSGPAKSSLDLPVLG